MQQQQTAYADPHPPYQRKCAFDIGDYGLGYCANSLELGCDCLVRLNGVVLCVESRWHETHSVASWMLKF